VDTIQAERAVGIKTRKKEEQSNIWYKKCVHTYVNAKMLSVETNPRMGGGGG
jgi:hypothetical protein